MGLSDKAQLDGLTIYCLIYSYLGEVYMQSLLENDAALAANTMRSTLFFWWIAYLRQSQDYWWVCQEKGNCLDPRLHAVWQDFGDLFSYATLDDWFDSKGKVTFEAMHQSAACADCLQLVTKENLSSISLVTNSAFICVPIDMDLRKAQQAFANVLKQIRKERSQAYLHCEPLFAPPYQIGPIDPKSKKALINSFRVHLLKHYLDGVDSEHIMKKWGCYEMGFHLGIAKQQHPKPIDTLATAKKKQSCLRALVCQNKVLARTVIDNVEVGKFPCRDKVNVQARWSPQQNKRKLEAIAAGAWHSPNWLSQEFAFLNPAQSRLLPVDHQSPKEEVISILDSFSKMPMPFLLPKRAPRRYASSPD
ncbi:hypothetical protein [Polynucleobacter sp. JS-Fieb-80-E5]|uniref:hypothetical protein n=1 Tax=Polynucleobacter sp. JS-Fieb-80-E5 TaxID=2081050 RepID=UPI001C0D5761|nr:hypothetical protein [Polynucleobacter sp. JS-Fieb-80-E5]MBU3618802.1 hypothetical protein [Polynucleobacter sp. JS-Fieb-80-E5]